MLQCNIYVFYIIISTTNCWVLLEIFISEVDFYGVKNGILFLFTLLYFILFEV